MSLESNSIFGEASVWAVQKKELEKELKTAADAFAGVCCFSGQFVSAFFFVPISKDSDGREVDVDSSLRVSAATVAKSRLFVALIISI